ncbi:MAG: MOSC N-terminal beta barrel domain-containing protein, partial [Alphaproteobacteria bacterium]
MEPSVASIHRYPVKGLSPEPLARVELSPGEGLPHDRRYALHVGAGGFDPAAPAWMAKTNFLMLMRDERLARLRTRFDPATSVLSIERDGKQVARGNLEEPAGRMVVE